jgi:hypothetical protein
MASLSISAPAHCAALSSPGPASPTALSAAGEATPPGYLGGVPLMRCGPSGPDPFAEQREEARKKAQEGALCPVNQHGCMYFSASEWRFCPMCEWECGHGIGEHNGTLMPLGGPVELHTKDIAEQNAILISRKGLDDLFSAPGTKSWTGLIVDWHWNKLSPADGRVLLTHNQMHNLLMIYGSPNGCLTEARWAALKTAWPAP